MKNQHETLLGVLNHDDDDDDVVGRKNVVFRRQNTNTHILWLETYIRRTNERREGVSHSMQIGSSSNQNLSNTQLSS